MSVLGLEFDRQPDYINSWEVFGTVYVDMHYKDLLGSIERVGYHISVPDFCLVLHVDGL